ncbi:hypothetical protein G6701_01515 [Polynucleobacter paneuropaeus]|nr:hypothetical protein [Polynucleobacter paneuropaeus]
MKMNEIMSVDEKLKLANLIFNNTFKELTREITQAHTLRTQPVAKPMAKAVPTKTKPRAPKRAPMAPAPKPLPKPRPLAQTPTQMHHQQQKSQQDYATAVKNTFDKDAAKMPKSLQPLPTNIISPIGGTDPELHKKLHQVGYQKDPQNRDYGSKLHFPE